MKRQFKVRLIEKFLPVDTESEVVATAVTSTQLPVASKQPLPPRPTQYP